MAEANAQAQIAAQADRAHGTGPFSAEAFTYHPEADRAANYGWVRAVAKDERAQRHMQKGDTPRQRSWQSRRATWRARQDWQRTVDGHRRQVHAWLEPRVPAASYAKGDAEAGVDLIRSILRWLQLA
jgi:hypothetical protein